MPTVGRVSGLSFSSTCVMSGNGRTRQELVPCLEDLGLEEL